MNTPRKLKQVNLVPPTWKSKHAWKVKGEKKEGSKERKKRRCVVSWYLRFTTKGALGLASLDVGEASGGSGWFLLQSVHPYTKNKSSGHIRIKAKIKSHNATMIKSIY